jgi:hypothetical protein
VAFRDLYTKCRFEGICYRKFYELDPDSADTRIDEGSAKNDQFALFRKRFTRPLGQQKIHAAL